MAEGKTVSVSVLLSADPERRVSVPLATTNLGGVTGADYSGVPASLTFGNGETKATFAFMAAADMVGDKGESVKLGFVNLPTGVSEGAIHEATVSIIDPTGLSGAFPRTQLLDWFNRATAVETVNALGDRFREAPRGPRAVLRGIALRPMGNKAAASLVNRQDIYGWPERESRLGGFSSARELLSDSSFYLPLQPDEFSSAGEQGNFVAWGKGSTLQVQNRHGNVSIDGSTATFRMGVDGEWDEILAGIAIGKTAGDARFDWASCTDLCSGRMEADLTSVQAYARANPRPHLSVWAALGYGTGEARETFDKSELLGIDGFTMKADLEQVMAALGAYGALVPAETAYGFEVGLQTDALFARMAADYAGDEYDADTTASRVRLALVAERDHQYDWGGVIAGAMETGLRLDGGDGVTGAGLELAGRVHHFNPILGLTASASLGGVLIHTDDDFREWGISGSLRWDPGRFGRGGAVSIQPAWGVPAARNSLSQSRAVSSLANNRPSTPRGRLNAEFSYGFAALRGKGTHAPYAGFSLEEDAAKTVRAGWKFKLDERLHIAFEGSRQFPHGPRSGGGPGRAAGHPALVMSSDPSPARRSCAASKNRRERPPTMTVRSHVRSLAAGSLAS